MAVKLVRANSDEPNVQNNDDCRLLRYACGGYDGVVKDYGNELNYEISGSNFTIKSGEFVIDGWQGKNDGNGVTIQVDNLSGVQYYVVYAEIDLSISENQKAEIKATYNTAYYPTITKGDDLTTTPSGVARLVLYKFEASNGTISNVEQVFEVMEYGWVKNAENADNADNATNAENCIKNVDDDSYANLRQTTNGGRLYVGSNADVEIIEKRTLLWSGSQVIGNTSGVGTEITMSENVSEGDKLEIYYDCKYSASGYPNFKIIKCVVERIPSAYAANSIGIRLNSIVGGQTTSSGFSFTQDNFRINNNKLIYDGGYYLLNVANSGGTLLANNAIRLVKVYKIIS